MHYIVWRYVHIFNYIIPNTISHGRLQTIMQLDTNGCVDRSTEDFANNKYLHLNINKHLQ